MSNKLNLALRLSYDGRAVSEGARQNTAELNRIPGAIQRQTSANQQLGVSQAAVMQQQGAMSRQIGMVNSAYTQLGATITALVSIGTAAMFVRDTAAAQALDQRIKGLTGSTREYAAAKQYLFTTADRLNTSYTTLAESYSQILTLQDANVISQTEGKAILEGMANAAAKTGASNAQLGLSFTGMTQSMTAGTVNATDLIQVTQPLPGLMQKLDKAVGGTAGGFKQLVNGGQMTSAMFKNYLITALNEYAGAAQATEGTINASFAKMGNEYQRLIQQYEQPVGFAVTSVIDTITDVMRYLRENETVVNGLIVTTGTLATVLTGHLAAGLVASGKGFLANIAVKNQAIIADVALTKQAHLTAIAENERAVQDVARIKRNITMAQTSGQLLAAENALTAAKARGTAAQVAATTTANAYTVAATRATIASRGLATVMGLLGGPVGIAVTAGLALAFFASKSGEASFEARNLTAKLKEAKQELDQLTHKQIKVKLLTFDEDNGIKQAKDRLRALKAQEEYNKVQAERGFENPNKESQVQQAKRSADIEQLEADLKKTIELKAQMQAILDAPDDKPNATSPTALPKSTIPERIKQLELSLASEKVRLKAGYDERNALVNEARNKDAGNAEYYNNLLKASHAKYNEDVAALAAKGVAEKTRIENEAEQKRKNDLQANLENRIAVMKGFAGREALATYNNELAVEQARQQARIDAERRSQLGLAANDEVGELEYNTDNQIRDLERQEELNSAAGYHSQREANEAAHQERLMQIKSRHTGALQSSIVAFANFEKQTEADKASAIVGLGAATFKTMAGQSKTAFKAYKAFAIAQAVINTYQGATSAFTSLASIPIIGPVLGGVAAAAAVMSGLQQVRQIKAQQPAGIAHGGLDYVPNESTYMLQRGERVLSPKQNIEISQMARRYNAGGAANDGAAGGGVSISITNQITVQGNVNEQGGQTVGDDIARQVVGMVVANIRENGAIIRAVRGAA